MGCAVECGQVVAAETCRVGRRGVECIDRWPAMKGVFKIVADLGKLGLDDYQLAGRVHQLVRPIGIDAHRLGRLVAGSPKERIRDSGLWLVNELWKTPLSDADLGMLSELIGIS